MGSGVSINAEAVTEMAFKSLIEDKEECDLLFHSLCHSVTHHSHNSSEVETKRINLKDQVSLINCVEFLKNEPTPSNAGEAVLRLLCADMAILKHSHKLACGKKHPDFIPQKRFKLFLHTLFFYFHLWKIFLTSDCQIDDRKVFKTEYVKSKDLVAAMPGVVLAEGLTEDLWNESFEKLDKNKDGWISFTELCKYASKHITFPTDFTEFHAEEELHFQSVSEAVAELEAREAAEAEAAQAATAPSVPLTGADADVEPAPEVSKMEENN